LSSEEAMTNPTSSDPARDGAQMNFDGRMSYGDYLHLDKILSAQKPLSTAHDEMLFVIQHQTSELWMRLAIHELSAARKAIAADNLAPAMKMLARVSRIFEQLNNAWDVLRTMTPSDYTQFRDKLGQSSGFQSWQYRQIEFLLGNRNHAMLRPHEHDKRVSALLREELQRASFYDEVLRFASRKGIAMPTHVLARDVSATHQFDEQVMAGWRQVYENPEAHWQLYELAEKLVDFEDYFRRWRFNHVTTVERVIGFKRGTGGTGGVSYLKRMLEIELFPELWRVRTVL
jgi:tryptophan 2,3-dioxygenase